jgi:hypothetical protein
MSALQNGHYALPGGAVRRTIDGVPMCRFMASAAFWQVLFGARGLCRAESCPSRPDHMQQ